MILKKLKTPSGASTVITTTKNYDEYIYFKDVPPKDIFFPEQQDEILKTEKYLEL